MIIAQRLDLESVFLAAPSSSDERLRKAAEVSRGFVYAVSTMGITGTRADVDAAAQKLTERLYANGATEVCVGLGISTPEQVKDVVSLLTVPSWDQLWSQPSQKRVSTVLRGASKSFEPGLLGPLLEQERHR